MPPEDDPADERPPTKEEWDAYEFHRDVSGVYTTGAASIPADVTVESITRTAREFRATLGPDPFGPRDFKDADGRVYARIEGHPFDPAGYLVAVRTEADAAEVLRLNEERHAGCRHKIRVAVDPAVLDVPLADGEDR